MQQAKSRNKTRRQYVADDGQLDIRRPGPWALAKGRLGPGMVAGRPAGRRKLSPARTARPWWPPGVTSGHRQPII